MTPFEERVEAYLKSERQWSRPLRIQHAEFMRKKAQTEGERQFWNVIIKRNKD